jgi:hypothetical protein
MKTKAVVCPHCGSKSVRLRILNAIRRAGPDGISRSDLVEMIYEPGTNPSVISVNVNQINKNLLKEHIKGGRAGYRLVPV